MNQREMKVLAVLIADEVVKRIGGGVCNADEEMVTAKEAAKIVGYSVNYLRRNRDRFSYVKAGTEKQGRLMFRKKDLIDYVTHPQQN